MQLTSILTDKHLYTPQLRKFAQKTVQLCSSRWMILALIVLGILRGIFLLMAYPPAHMSDADLFFLYAERIYGAHNWPLLDQVTYPLYPALILVTYKWFGSAYLLVAVQFVMSVSIAPLYYYALKPYSAVLATLVALVTLVDFQSGTTFNFTGAEPLYMLLIALTFTVLMRQTAPEASRNWSVSDSTVGILLVLMWLTRTIGRYLILPYGIVFFLYTRSIKRTLTLIAGFVVALLAYMLLSTLVLGDVAGLNATDYAFTRIMHHHPEWVDADNGPYTKQWLEYTPGCTS
ncbi:MAG: hypothetical protein KC496_19060, partial [Anaerolineae bacterium]|nr:hypothetical protein [Anaerolineae bacterium]